MDKLQQRLDRTDHARVVQSLNEVGFGGAVDLLALYGGRGPDLKPWLEDTEINCDRNLRLQYLAGLGLNTYQGELIYNEMMVYCTFPEELFVGSGRSREALKDAIEIPY